MKFFKHTNRFFALSAGMGLLMGGLLTGCGGGSGGGSAGEGATQTGAVAVLLTDAPSDDFSQVIVTVDEVSLLSNDGDEFTLFKGTREMDLLALQDIQDLFMVHPEVPVGDYDRIRLHVKDLKLVKADQQPVLSEDIVLGSQTVIIRLADSPLRVFVGETVTVQLDLDVDQSMDDLGVSPGRYRFRPVVLVEFLTGLPTRLVRASGEIVEINSNMNSFLLRRTDPKFSELGDGDENRPHLIRVDVSDTETQIFEADGQPGKFDSLETGQKVHVRGLLSIAEGLHLDARIIEIGQFTRLRGTIESNVVENHFGFCPDPCPVPPGPDDIISVQVFPETLVLGELTPGKRALIEGVMDNLSQFNAAVIVVKPALEKHKGTIDGLNLTARTFNLIQTLPCEPLCLALAAQIIPIKPAIPVLVEDNALILRIGRESDNRLEIKKILFEELKDGAATEVIGSFGQQSEDGNLFHAIEVITFATQPIP
jgi:hypothetical protein